MSDETYNSETIENEKPQKALAASPDAYNPPLPRPLTKSDEHTWAMLAHISILANLVTGFLGPGAALLIYLLYKDRSRYVAYHSLQSFVFQMAWWIGVGAVAGLLWAISGILTVILVGFCLMPIAFLVSLIPFGALIYGFIGAIQTSQGQDFRYWLIGDWVRGTLEGNQG